MMVVVSLPARPLRKSGADISGHRESDIRCPAVARSTREQVPSNAHIKTVERAMQTVVSRSSIGTPNHPEITGVAHQMVQPCEW